METDIQVQAPEIVERYGALLLPRLIEEKMLRLIRQGRLSKWFSGYGQEAIAVGCALALGERDYILPTHRNLGVWTTRGVDLKRLMCQLMGKQGGYTHGRDRTFHFGLPEKRIVGMISHLAAMLPVACGLGLSAQLKRESFVVLSFVGEGATREGDFHEALSLAAVWKLPVVFVVENNGYGLSTPTREAIPVENIADAAVGYGIPGYVVDGNDLDRVVDAVTRAAQHARAGNGPTLLEMKTFRVRGHEEASGTKYVPAELIEEWTLKDPVHRYSERLLSGGTVGPDELDLLKENLERQVEEAAEFALHQPDVESTTEAERAAVYAPAPVRATTEPKNRRELRFIDAVSEGLRTALAEDERVLLMGQDVAEYGGVFKVSQGFVDQFGKERIRNTPIIESGIIGAAVGLALEGFKPVVEMQYGDFISCGFNQIVNNAATTHFRWGAPVGITIRAPFGGHIGAGPFHSQSMEAWFCHVPGLKVVVPYSPYDAKGLLRSSIEDPNPVLFFEHKYLYRSLKGMVPEAAYEVEIGKGNIVLRGSNLTIVSWGIGVGWALEEAAYQSQRGVSIEVIDLRTLVPWDETLVIDSVACTNRLIVLHEAPGSGGFGAEVAASIAEKAFGYLDAPPIRVTGEQIPVPFASNLEQNIYSALPRLRPAVERLLNY